MQYTSLSQFIITYFDIRLQILLLSRYDSIPIGMLGGLWSYSVLSLIKPPKRWLQVDSWWIVPIVYFPVPFLLHITYHSITVVIHWLGAHCPTLLGLPCFSYFHLYIVSMHNNVQRVQHASKLVRRSQSKIFLKISRFSYRFMRFFKDFEIFLQIYQIF